MKDAGPPSRPAREEVLEPLRRTLDWLLSLRDGAGRIVCPEHRLEHTGKSAGAAVIAAELARLDRGSDRAARVAAAVQQGRRMVARLEREGTSPCHTFRPGMHDPFNCSNNVIDGGACSDALAHLVRTLGPELEAADREAFAQASALHARTYLRYAARDKPVPAQRAWGLSGLAHACEVVPDEELEQAALEAVGELEAIQHPDGSYPYQPLAWSGVDEASAGPAARGASDVSSFYQSRVTAFLLFALERLGRRPDDPLFRRPLRAGLDFLAALQGPDGVKCGLVEAKPWYWGATYEVASHPFDVYAFARGHALFGRRALAAGAARAFRAWVDHLGADGRPASHRAGPGRGRSFQCPVFWAAHAMWIARAAEDLDACLDLDPTEGEPGAGLDLSIAWFPQAQLARLEDGRVVAWVRGARPGGNVHHGSPHGAGLLRAVRRADGADLVARCRLGGRQEGEWSGYVGAPSPARGWRAGGGELRFAGWLARVHARAGRHGAALRAPLDVLRRGVLAPASARVSSAFVLDPAVEVLADGVHLASGVAWRDGVRADEVLVERTFQVDGEGLVVTERLRTAGSARGLEYRVPAAATDVEREPGELRYRLA